MGDEEFIPSCSNFHDLYKNKNRIEKQRLKREVELKQHRQGLRMNALMRARRLTSDLLEEDEKEEEGMFDTEPAMTETVAAEPATESKTKKYHSIMKGQLMSGEWLLSVPPNFESEYCMKLFPCGLHVLVVAANHTTRIYSRSGGRIMTFTSQLPGGGMEGMHPSRKDYFTLLDCVLSEDKQILWVVDVMHWKLNSYYESPAETRFENLEGLYLNQLAATRTDSGISFAVLKAFGVDHFTLMNVFSQPAAYTVDGVMFYHREGKYIPGHTSLLGWLKPYMVAEMFSLPSVHPSYSVERPDNYKDVSTSIRDWNEAHPRYWKTVESKDDTQGPQAMSS